MAWKNPFKDKENSLLKTSGGILAGEIFAGIVATAIAPFLDKFLHRKNNPIRKKVADWIEPHVKQIEQSPVHKELHALGEEEAEKEKQSYHTMSIRGRAERLADILLETGTLFVAENVAAFGTQEVLKKANVLGLGKEKGFSPVANFAIGAGMHLGCIAVSATILEKPTEWLYRKLAKVLQKVAGMKEEEALRTANSLTFIVGPDLVAGLAQVAWSNRQMFRK